MNADAREPWDELMKRLARAKGFRRLTPKEAQAEYDAAESVSIPEDQIERIVRNVVSGCSPRRARHVPRVTADEVVDEEMLALNRNAGELDDETKRKLDELRRKNLTDDEAGEDDARLED